MAHISTPGTAVTYIGRLPAIGLFSYARARESKVITRGDALKALEVGSKNFIDFVNYISKFEIGNYILTEIKLERTTTPTEFERACYRFLHSELTFLRNMAPRKCREFLDAYVSKYDALNIANIVASLALGTRAKNLIPMGILVDRNLLDALANSKSVDDLYSVVKEVNIPWLEDLISIFKMGEIPILAKYFEYLIETAQNLSPAHSITKALECMRNYLIIERLLKYMVSGKKLPEELHRYLPSDLEFIIWTPSEALMKLEATHPQMYRIIKKYLHGEELRPQIRIALTDSMYQQIMDILMPHILSYDSVLRYIVMREYEVWLLSLVFSALYLGKEQEIREVLS